MSPDASRAGARKGNRGETVSGLAPLGANLIYPVTAPGNVARPARILILRTTLVRQADVRAPTV